MTSSFRRFFLVGLATAAVVGLSIAGGGAAAAAGIQVGAVQASGGSQGGNGQGGNGQGGNGQGGSGGSGGTGAGTATPELPSGVLLGLGLVPLATGLVLVWRRRRTDPA
jgi:hypothetical protein